MKLQVQKRSTYTFVIGSALFVVCLIYIPQWGHYAPSIRQSVPSAPYLTPWTVLFVSALSLALALVAAPFRAQHPVQTILSKALCALVICFVAVFLLEYACGIRVPDLDIFFLPDASGQRVTLYAARPSPHSATTSLLFASALLIFQPDSGWRTRAFQICALAALVLPTVAGVGYLIGLLSPRSPRGLGLSLPAVVLYFMLGSGVLRLPFGSHVAKAVVPRSHVGGSVGASVSVSRRTRSLDKG